MNTVTLILFGLYCMTWGYGTVMTIGMPYKIGIRLFYTPMGMAIPFAAFASVMVLLGWALKFPNPMDQGTLIIGVIALIVGIVIGLVTRGPYYRRFKINEDTAEPGAESKE